VIILFDLIIIWESGERESYTYTEREEAEKAELAYQIAFGHQIHYISIVERRLKY
jgi:hypothetical protein